MLLPDMLRWKKREIKQSGGFFSGGRRNLAKRPFPTEKKSWLRLRKKGADTYAEGQAVHNRRIWGIWQKIL